MTKLLSEDEERSFKLELALHYLYDRHKDEEIAQDLDFGQGVYARLEVKHVGYYKKKFKLVQFHHTHEDHEGADHDAFLKSLSAREMKLWDEMLIPPITEPRFLDF
jgi:hypothetical protein